MNIYEEKAADPPYTQFPMHESKVVTIPQLMPEVITPSHAVVAHRIGTLILRCSRNLTASHVCSLRHQTTRWLIP